MTTAGCPSRSHHAQITFMLVPVSIRCAVRSGGEQKLRRTAVRSDRRHFNAIAEQDIEGSSGLYPIISLRIFSDQSGP
jgi:hypothetical protein